MTRNRNSAVEKKFLVDDHVRTQNLDESEKELFPPIFPLDEAITVLQVTGNEAFRELSLNNGPYDE